MYSNKAVNALATALLQAHPESYPLRVPAGYTLVDHITVGLSTKNPGDEDYHAQLTMVVRGLWIESFSPKRLPQFATQIAGMSATDARTLLLRAGVLVVQLSSSGTLPRNADDIIIVMKKLA